MKLFIKHYFELKDLLTRLETQDEEINSEINNLRADSIVNAEFLRDFYTKQIGVHKFRKDLLNLIFKHAENIDDTDEMKEFIRIVKEKHDDNIS